MASNLTVESVCPTGVLTAIDSLFAGHQLEHKKVVVDADVDIVVMYTFHNS